MTDRFQWLTQKIEEPTEETELATIEQQSFTFPDVIKNMQIRKSLGATGLDKRMAKREELSLRSTSDIVEVEQFEQRRQKEQSKRQLMQMLSIEEINFKEARTVTRQNLELSFLLIQVVEHRLFYYATITERITQSIRKSIIMLTYSEQESVLTDDMDLRTFERHRRTTTIRQTIILEGLRDVQDAAISFLTELESDEK